MKKWFELFCAVGLALGLMVTAAQAQTAPKVGDAIGDWIFNCQALSATQTVCVLQQTIVQKESKQPVMRLTLRKLGKEQKLGLVVRVPLGVYLATGIGGKVDEGKQFNLIWQSCTKQGCQAALSLDDGQKTALKSGKQLFIGFKARPDKDAVTVAASLKGVTAGLKALGVE